VDEATLQFYRGHAEAYAGREITSRKARLSSFLKLLPPGGRILELGCGAGGDTAEMLARGFDVRATDGSPEMAAVASKRLGSVWIQDSHPGLFVIQAWDGPIRFN
jgi:cyclopropane fatty-acyl-phospholipid synthase-like methyltransferase